MIDYAVKDILKGESIDSVISNLLDSNLLTARERLTRVMKARRTMEKAAGALDVAYKPITRRSFLKKAARAYVHHKTKSK